MWSKWIENYGHCPVDGSTEVKVMYRDGTVSNTCLAGNRCWAFSISQKNHSRLDNIIKYKIELGTETWHDNTTGEPPVELKKGWVVEVEFMNYHKTTNLVKALRWTLAQSNTGIPTDIVRYRFVNKDAKGLMTWRYLNDINKHRLVSKANQGEQA
jgi:hypothetical protein